MPTDRPARHRRAVVLIALAVVVMVSSGVAYLRSTKPPLAVQFPLTSPQPEGGPVAISSVLPSPTPLPRSAGIVRVGPTSVLIEQFGGLNDRPPYGLKASAQVKNAAALRKFVHELNALPVFPGGVFSCPQEDGSHFSLAFTYADATMTSVKVEAGGCGQVFVGGSTEAVAWTPTTPTFLKSVSGLLAHPPAG